MDLDVEFSFMQVCSSFGCKNEKSKVKKLNIANNASPIEFSVSPNVIKIGPSIQSILNVTAKFKNTYLL